MQPNFHQLLRQQHYASIAFSLTEDELNYAAQCFLQFLALPEETKRQLHFPAQNHRASADGYTDKSHLDNKDPKQFFHWTPKMTRHPVCADLMTTSSAVAAFFSIAERIYGAVEKALYALFLQHLPEYKSSIFSHSTLLDGTLRFLCYLPKQQQQRFGAQAHFDKGFSTLAIADSAPGLRIGCCDKHALQAVNYQPGKALFMPAWMLFQASNGVIKPAWHDVVHSHDEAAISAGCARWSIVFFINSPGTPFSSWEVVHTPLH